MGQQDMLSLHDIWNEAFLRHSRAVTAKKCTKKRDARAKLLFRVLLFWRSRSRRRREILRFLMRRYTSNNLLSENQLTEQNSAVD